MAEQMASTPGILSIVGYFIITVVVVIFLGGVTYVEQDKLVKLNGQT